MSPIDLTARVAELERQLHRQRLAGIIAGLLLFVLMAGAWNRHPASPEVLRARGLVIVDAAGRERIVLGAPVPDPIEGKRVSAATGMVINDSAGVERFGLGLFPNGRVVMGLDAPPGTGDDRNRERISLVADQHGGAYIRLLDRKTRAQAFLRLGDDDNAYLEFLNWEPERIVVRRVGFGGDTLVARTR